MHAGGSCKWFFFLGQQDIGSVGLLNVDLGLQNPVEKADLVDHMQSGFDDLGHLTRNFCETSWQTAAARKLAVLNEAEEEIPAGHQEGFTGIRMCAIRARV